MGKTSVAAATACCIAKQGIDALIENEAIWGNIKGYIEKLMLSKTEKSIEVEELLVFPGFEDLISLLKIKQLNDENNYDVLIVDCAPTGETMSLLKFPVPDERTFDEIESLYNKIDELHELMHSEVRDYATLLTMGENLFKEVSAEEVLFKDKIFEIENQV